MNQASWIIKEFATLPSTQDKAKELALSSDFKNTTFAVIASAQTSGRGRHGNHWVSPAGNLYATLRLPFSEDNDKAGHYVFLTSLALCEVMRAGLINERAEKIKIKWPNDLLFEEAKLSGILLETELKGAQITDIFIGMGVNLAIAPEFAMDLLSLGYGEISPKDFLNRFLVSFEKYKALYEEEGFAEIKALWLVRAKGIGQSIKVRGAQDTKYGVFDGLDDDGALILRLDNGETQRIRAGEVHLQ